VAPSDSEEQRPNSPEWSEVVEHALAGDNLAYGRLARLVTGYLARWRAYDFRPDWEDIVQEVLVSTVAAQREGRLETAAAFQAYVRQATRFKFVDLIRAQQRVASDRDVDRELDRASAGGDLAWPPMTSIQSAAADLQVSVRQALEKLTDQERAAVLEVYLRGRTYQEAAEVTGIPLGTLKRALRTGHARLRKVLDDERRA
jgi:RNA polymerase sigma-70 factor (ECF subfamily)